ncbi:MAG: ribonuclease HII [bacterium]
MSRQKRPNWKREKLAWSRGEILAGVDEVGTGAWAGPIFAGAVIFPKYFKVPKLMDSKLLRPLEREACAAYLMKNIIWAVGRVEVFEIDELGLRPATYLAMRRAIMALPAQPTAVIVDAWTIPEITIPQEPIIKGDLQIASIAAASVIAKVQRDQVMREFGKQFPGYGFEEHKGYGTFKHQAALRALGPCRIHRFSYKPLKMFFSQIS